MFKHGSQHHRSDLQTAERHPRFILAGSPRRPAGGCGNVGSTEALEHHSVSEALVPWTPLTSANVRLSVRAE